MSQTRPQEKCPVCGREFELYRGGYWVCPGDVETHSLSGPCDDPTGEKIDAVVRRIRGTLTHDSPQRKELLDVAKVLMGGMLAYPCADGNFESNAYLAVQAARTLIAAVGREGAK